MSIVNPSPRPKGSGGVSIVLILLVIFGFIFVIGSIAVVAVILYVRNHNILGLPSPPPSTPYVGADTLPPGLPPTADVFKKSTISVDLSKFSSTTIPAAPPSALEVAAQAEKILNKPLPSNSETGPAGEGLIVCDPVPTSSVSKDVSGFGVGCGHWLHLIAAGQPQFGRTPELASRKQIETELPPGTMQMTAQQCRTLSTRVGVTDVACGTIRGTTRNCTLQYQVYSLPALNPVGAPIVATGTLDQIDSALPKMAQMIDKRLGLNSPTVPASTNLSPADLITFNSLILGHLNTDQLLQLSKLGDRSPLAGILSLEQWGRNDDVFKFHTVRTLIAQVPTNALVINTIAYDAPESLRPYQSSVSSLISRYPGSALLTHVDIWEQRTWGNRISELQGTIRLLQDSPNDPESWLARSQTLQNICSDLGSGQYPSTIPDSNMYYLSALYPIAESDARKATELDPLDGHAWYILSVRAANGSGSVTAMHAYQEAQEYDDNKSEVDAWGLEIFQRKYYDDPFSLEMLATKAAKEKYEGAAEADAVKTSLEDVYSATNDTKYSDSSYWVTANVTAYERKRISDDPVNPVAHWQLAYSLAQSPDRSSMREATREYRIAEHFMPNSSELHTEFAENLSQRGKSAIKELRWAAALNPYSADINCKLGDALKESGDNADAIKELTLSLALDPKQQDAHYALGLALATGESKYALGIAQLKIAYEQDFTNSKALYFLCDIYDRSQQPEASLAAGKAALSANDSFQNLDNLIYSIHDIMADDYLQLKQWNKSLAETNLALQLDSKDSLSQENIAEAEWGEGKKADAIAQWERVAGSRDPWVSAMAAKLLKVHAADVAKLAQQSGSVSATDQNGTVQ